MYSTIFISIGLILLNSISVIQCGVVSEGAIGEQERSVEVSRVKRQSSNWQHGSTHGSNHGDPFNDLITVRPYNVYFPKRITMRNATWLVAIQIDYSTQCEVIDAPKHGGDGGDIGQFILDSDERIIKVTGGSGAHVDRLQFTTNKGRVSPVYGGNGGGGFTEEYPGYVVSYISGRSGVNFDQVQFHWVRQP